jgi:uncharacterized lipoprotein YmbA
MTRRLLAATLLLTLSACASTTPPRHYLLTATAAQGAALDSAAAIGVGPVRIAGYLDNPRLMRRAADAHELLQDEDSRWAEPLADGIERVLSANLATRLGGATVYDYPWRRDVNLDYRVLLRVQRFETQGDGRAELIAHWALRDGEGAVLTAERESRHVLPPTSDTPAGGVAAQSALLGALADEIAGEIRALHET